MTAQSIGPLVRSLDSSAVMARRLRNRGLVNILRMGHCAPSIMQAMLDVSEADAEWLVKLTAGLPGGIGNTRAECGGITAPLVWLGLRFGQEKTSQGLPVVVCKGHEHIRRFRISQGTTTCRGILGDARVPIRCIGVVRQAPVLCVDCIAADCAAGIPAGQQDAIARLHAHWQEKEFHCAHRVFRHLEHAIPVSEDLLNGSTAFTGGTVFAGMTCSALTAGVMALGLMRGEIENSYARVVRMIGLMAVRGDAFADDVNAFNRAMNAGNRLAEWFTAEFGSTQCAQITRCDFGTPEGAQRYIEEGATARCAAIAQSVARKVLVMLR